MKRYSIFALLLICLFAMTAGPLNAQQAKRTGPKYTDEYINKVNLTAEGVGFGYEVGYWAPSVAFGMKCLAPVGDSWGLEFRLFMPQGYMQFDYDPCVAFAIGYYRRTPVFMGLFRAYFGGYFHVGYRIKVVEDEKNPNAKEPMMDEKNKRIGFAGGGKIGLEFFVSESKSYFIEVGGQGPAHALQYDAGGMVMAGAIFYFGG